MRGRRPLLAGVHGRPCAGGDVAHRPRPIALGRPGESTLTNVDGLGNIRRREVSQVRTRLRRLRVDGRTFVWRAEIHHVQGSGDCHRCIRIRAWGAGKTSRALQADLLSVTWPAPWGACATDDVYPTPSDEQAIVKYALEHGWRPELHGGTFLLTEREHAARFSLPDFLLTDRLQTHESGDPTGRVVLAYEARRQ